MESGAKWFGVEEVLRYQSLEEQNLIGQSRRVRHHAPGDRLGQDGELVAPEARGNQDDAGVGFLTVDQRADELEEVRYVAGDQAAPLLGRIAELLEIAPASVTDFMGSSRVEPTLSKQCHDSGREILVQVELQPARRTRPGYRTTTPSGVRAAFSAIRRSISSR